jgi:hypothetical protein
MTSLDLLVWGGVKRAAQRPTKKKQHAAVCERCCVCRPRPQVPACASTAAMDPATRAAIERVFKENDYGSGKLDLLGFRNLYNRLRTQLSLPFYNIEQLRDVFERYRDFNGSVDLNAVLSVRARMHCVIAIMHRRCPTHPHTHTYMHACMHARTYAYTWTYDNALRWH